MFDAVLLNIAPQHRNCQSLFFIFSWKSLYFFPRGALPLRQEQKRWLPITTSSGLDQIHALVALAGLK